MQNHGLRNELTVILGFSELLIAQTPAGDPRRLDLEAIRDAAVSALRRLDNERQRPAPLRAMPEMEPSRRPPLRQTPHRSKRRKSGS